jgi:hypothetical protein
LETLENRCLLSLSVGPELGCETPLVAPVETPTGVDYGEQYFEVADVCRELDPDGELAVNTSLVCGFPAEVLLSTVGPDLPPSEVMTEVAAIDEAEIVSDEVLIYDFGGVVPDIEPGDELPADARYEAAAVVAQTRGDASDEVMIYDFGGVVPDIESGDELPADVPSSTVGPDVGYGSDIPVFELIETPLVVDDDEQYFEVAEEGDQEATVDEKLDVTPEPGCEIPARLEFDVPNETPNDEAATITKVAHDEALSEYRAEWQTFVVSSETPQSVFVTCQSVEVVQTSSEEDLSPAVKAAAEDSAVLTPTAVDLPPREVMTEVAAIDEAEIVSDEVLIYDFGGVVPDIEPGDESPADVRDEVAAAVAQRPDDASDEVMIYDFGGVVPDIEPGDESPADVEYEAAAAEVQTRGDASARRDRNRGDRRQQQWHDESLVAWLSALDDNKRDSENDTPAVQNSSRRSGDDDARSLDLAIARPDRLLQRRGNARRR